MDAETQRYAAIIKIKQARLHELDKQAAALGKYGTPPQIEMERQTLREEVGMFEVALESPASATATDELGARGRFAVGYQQNRKALERLDLLIRVLEMFGRLIIVIGIAVVVILIAVGVIAGYLLARGAV